MRSTQAAGASRQTVTLILREAEPTRIVAPDNTYPVEASFQPVPKPDPSNIGHDRCDGQSHDLEHCGEFKERRPALAVETANR